MKEKAGKGLLFAVLMGIVSMLGDITYEGGRSVVGPYMAMLGATPVFVGIITGVSEFAGYALRIVSGYLADRWQKWWFFTFAGYLLICAVPLMGLAASYVVVGILMIVERAGKALRAPGRDALMAFYTKELGRGKGFGIHEALDQIGGFIAPLIFAIVFIQGGSYKHGFALLWVPYVMCIIALVCVYIAVRRLFNGNVSVSDTAKPPVASGVVNKNFLNYAIFTGMASAGFCGYPLIAYHYQEGNIFPLWSIPLLYAVAMVVDGLGALAGGFIFDRTGKIFLLAIPVLNVFGVTWVFSSSQLLAISGIILWGLSLGFQESVLRAYLPALVPQGMLATAYGITGIIAAAGMMAANTVIGFLYSFGLLPILVYMIMTQTIAGVFLLMGKNP